MKDQQDRHKYPCDQCRRRKVRCDYGSPCDRCQSRSLTCTFETHRKKRGRKAGVGAVLEQLHREEDEPNTILPAYTPQTGPLSISHAESEAYERQSSLTSRPSAVLPAVTPHESNGHLTDPRGLDESGVTTDWISDVPVGDGGTPQDSFQNFDDFAQMVFANLNHVNQNLWSPLDSAEATTAHIGHPEAQPQTPHAISPTATAESVPSTEISAFEPDGTIARSVDLFFQHLYPTYPILIEGQIRGWLSNSAVPTKSEASMLQALCAATLVHVDSWSDFTFEQRTSMAKRYISLCLQGRLHSNFESYSFADVVSSLFIAITYFELRCRITSWIYVREAITLAMATGLHSAATNMSLTYEERIQQQRCYALLFVTERGASILDNLQISIMSVPALGESLLPGEHPRTLLGLRRLCDLFSLLDSNFVRLWNDLPLGSDDNYGYLKFADLQKHLRQHIDLRGVSDIQRADILITQQWLRLVFWQAQLRLGLITTASGDPAFTYEFPMEIASALCDVVKSLPPIAIQVHGLGIFKKQFEIAYSLLDALTLSNSRHANAYYETLRYLLFSLSSSPSSHQIYVKTLQKKIGGEQNMKYRRVADVELFRVNEPHRSHPLSG